MSAKMSPELRRLMRRRPLSERIRLWWLLWRLNSLDRAFGRSFVGDAGYHMSNIINGGRSDLILAKIAKVETEIAGITKPVLSGDAT